MKESFSLLREPRFLVLAVSNLITNLSYIMPALFLVDRAIFFHIAKADAALLLSVNGAANILSRVAVGVVVDRLSRDILWVYVVVVMVMGVATGLSVFCQYSYIAHATYAFVAGATIGE